MKTQIYVDELLPISAALPLLTDDFIESGQYCDETITTLRDALIEAQAKLSERKTVHEWLNSKGVPREEYGKPICLLRRLAIALEVHEKPMNPPALHCSEHGLIQPLRELSPVWYARNMDQPQDEPVRFVAADYRAARAIALSHFNGAVVAVWRDGEERA